MLDIQDVVSVVVTPSAETSASEMSRRSRLETIFSAHAAAVFAYARRRASRAEAEEVVSETFLVAWRRLDEVPEHSLPWLLGVARRVLANRRRADTRRAALRSRLGSAEREITAGSEPAEPETSIVLAALAGLPPAEREAITLLAWDGLGPDEAAVVLDCSRAAFYVRVHRARQRLAERLGPSDEPSTTNEVGQS